MLRKFVIVKPGLNAQCHIFCKHKWGYHSFCLGLGSLNIESHFVKFFFLKNWKFLNVLSFSLSIILFRHIPIVTAALVAEICS